MARCCGVELKKGSKFCSECGEKIKSNCCIQCNFDFQSAKPNFCPECGSKQSTILTCSQCGIEIKRPEQKFCIECGCPTKPVKDSGSHRKVSQPINHNFNNNKQNAYGVNIPQQVLTPKQLAQNTRRLPNKHTFQHSSNSSSASFQMNELKDKLASTGLALQQQQQSNGFNMTSNSREDTSRFKKLPSSSGAHEKIAPIPINTTFKRSFPDESCYGEPPTENGWYSPGDGGYSSRLQIMSLGGNQTQLTQMFTIFKGDRSVVDVTIVQKSTQNEAKATGHIQPFTPLNAAQLHACSLYGPSSLKFVEKHLGRKIGNGECWTLADEALKSVPELDRALGFNFGQEIPLSQAQPGDVLQFKSCIFSDGRMTQTVGFPDHTAMVKRVISQNVFAVYEQNPEPVHESTYNFTHHKSGTFKLFRPVTK